jgi:hypothetical protein
MIGRLEELKDNADAQEIIKILESKTKGIYVRALVPCHQ